MSSFTDTEIIVDFDKWCPMCKYKDIKSTDMPCDECLSHPVSFNSERPVNFEEE